MRTPRTEAAARCRSTIPTPHHRGRAIDPRVATTRAAIAAGRFRVDAEAVADSLLAELVMRLASHRQH
jgi:anti-sigma28 factor (negative regulator of flagellin synthesis)